VASNFQLTDLGEDAMAGTGDDVPIAASGFAYDDETQSARLLLAAPLPVGMYRAVILPGITDTTGNALSESVLWSFEVRDAVRWDGGGDGLSWNDPLNWDRDALPINDDRVVINTPGNLDVLYNGGTVSLSSLLCSEALTITGGTLSVANLERR
jgi:hypothetical protein